MPKLHDSTGAERVAGETPRASPFDRRALNMPNIITISRLVLACLLFWMIDAGLNWFLSAAVFIVAAATDAIDGYIARRFGLVTALGRVLDPFVDKVIVCGTFFFLLERSLQSGVTAWMVLVVVGREMLVTGLRSFLEQQGRDFSATWSGKIKMLLQCVAVTVSLLTMPGGFEGSGWLLARDASLWAAVAITFASGCLYVSRAVKLLRE